MKQLLISTFVFMIAGAGVGLSPSVASAQYAGQWNIIAESSERVFTNREFILLQNKYPIYLSGYDSRTVANASIMTRKLRYFGATSCRPADPRLEIEQASHSACLLPYYGGGCSSFNGYGPLPYPQDPCYRSLRY